ncbi:hypothetical protein HAX54_019422 [Datura stramonium]|uniref:Uncharacterized protein n=1 Tax=Datura stramonium TaxID=4076 RepID=A0ABS8UP44_DATST|nr:hypothetical protein [Datura stramonium]
MESVSVNGLVKRCDSTKWEITHRRTARHVRQITGETVGLIEIFLVTNLCFSGNSPVGITNDDGFYPVYWFLPMNSSALRGSVSAFSRCCPLDKTVGADNVITLDTKTDKDAPALMRAKGTKNKTQSPPSMPSSTPEGQFQEAEAPATTPTDLLKITQMAMCMKVKL